ncbi:hypothetical protein E2320_009476, partial [Naja naja]
MAGNFPRWRLREIGKGSTGVPRFCTRTVPFRRALELGINSTFCFLLILEFGKQGKRRDSSHAFQELRVLGHFLGRYIYIYIYIHIYIYSPFSRERGEAGIVRDGRKRKGRKRKTP